MADSTPRSYHTDPTLWLYTSLTSGSSHIISATSRMQTILKANKIEFQALDVATDEKARMLWGRRAGKRKLPGLVRYGMIVGDLEEVEEWNEYGELKENVALPSPAKPTPATPTPSVPNTPSKAPDAPPPPASITETPSDAPKTTATTTTTGTPSESSSSGNTAAGEQANEEPPSNVSAETKLSMAMRQAGFEAAKKAGDAKSKARAEALEASRAKSAGAQKLDNSGPSGMPPPSGTTEAGDAKKPESGVTSVDGAADVVPATDEGKNEEAEEKDKIEETTTAAKPQPIVNETGETATKSEPQHIPSAKEAEEEANKAIIADESTHVHIAGSPQPHASPGMKYPRDDPDEEVTTDSTMNGVLEKEKIRTEDLAATGKGGKLTMEEDAAGKVDSVDTIPKLHEGDETLDPASLTETSRNVEEETKANPELNKTEKGEAEIKIDALPLTVEKKTTEAAAQPKFSTESANSPEAESTATHAKPDLPETKTQEQRAASRERAGESVDD